MCTQMVSARGRGRGQMFAGNDKNSTQSPRLLMKGNFELLCDLDSLNLVTVRFPGSQKT